MTTNNTQTKIRKGRPKGKGGRARFNREKPEFEEKLLDLARVTRVVAGGKRFRFRATVAVGDRKGSVGVGVAKGNDVAQAIQKAAHQAKRRMVKVPIVDGTIPREVRVKYKAAVVYLKPAPAGRGINAGGAVRVVSDLAGVSDIIGKTLSRTTNKLNTARATIEGFKILADTAAISPQAKSKHQNQKADKKDVTVVESEEKQANS